MNVLGLMSGSSLDGLDLALCQFRFGDNTSINYELLQTRQCDFGQELFAKLRAAPEMDARSIFLLDAELSEYIGNACKDFIADSEHAVDLIASHGHTVFHHPESLFTTQLGNGGIISQIAKTDVVCDFRSSDIGAGGLGAPCAPIADQHLFSEVDLFLNIGGISNISFVSDDVITAFDISPANQLLNYLAQLKGYPYDKDGAFSSSGHVNESLMRELIKANKLQNANPRALDNSWIQKNFIPLLPTSNVNDTLRTVVEFINIEIINAIKFLKLAPVKRSILITGGGAFNKFLLDNLLAKLSDLQVAQIQISDEIINFKEAMLIALMGFMRWNKIPNVLKSVTGASRDTIGGCLYAY